MQVRLLDGTNLRTTRVAGDRADMSTMSGTKRSVQVRKVGDIAGVPVFEPTAAIRVGKAVQGGVEALIRMPR